MFKLNDFTKEKLEEMRNIFIERNKLKEQLGGCPHDDERVKANCFYCDECWISAIEKAIDLKESK